jgi:site-specific recombinase XerD
MKRDQLSFVNPNRLYGCHPLDLRSYFEDLQLFNDIDKTFPLAATQTDISKPQICKRRQALDRILNRISISALPCKDYLANYLRYKYRKNCQANTLRQTDTSLTQFLSFYEASGKRHLEQMERGDIEAFVEHVQDRGLKPNSVRTRMCAVYAFVRFLIEKKVVGYGLLERRIKLKLPDRLPRAIDPEAVDQLLSVIDNVRDRAMILLLLRTGMRIGELLNTKVDDVDLMNQKILIYQASKTLVGRVVYYSDDAKEALLAWLRARDRFKEYLFYGQGRPSLSYESARSMFKRYLEKAGLMYSGYTLHCLRHTFATDLLNARMRLECLQILLGHTNLEVTRRYARLTDKTREQEYFTAMERIVKGNADADDQCDY